MFIHFFLISELIERARYGDVVEDEKLKVYIIHQYLFYIMEVIFVYIIHCGR